MIKSYKYNHSKKPFTLKHGNKEIFGNFFLLVVYASDNINKYMQLHWYLNPTHNNPSIFLGGQKCQYKFIQIVYKKKRFSVKTRIVKKFQHIKWLWL